MSIHHPFDEKLIVERVLQQLLPEYATPLFAPRKRTIALQTTR